ncbi:MAG: 16S rRNA (guanine(527)-N(7))-methyltransferase RsmG [Bacteroidales bacterium]|nr:16S rRNA (guanine(527)-N(7))-methyltransferase RsmG [Bacteroidales bacterium]
MSLMDIILKYFPNLTERQREQFAALLPLYEEWNAQINVISRKDMEHFYEHHVLHSLAIAKVMEFASMTEVLDVGTGGGFPGVPLAIMFPDARFTLIDSIGKKIKVVNDVIGRLGLTNSKAMQIRAEQLDGEYDFVVSRAVTTLGEFVPWVKGKMSKSQYNKLRNGILYLKGGDLTNELFTFRHKVKTWDISEWFEEEFFETKKVIYLPL